MLFDLFYVFAKIGAFTIGGGYAMVPLIQSEVVDKRNWIDREEFVDILAVSQSTPGALAINMASFIGFRKKGILGSVVATLGCVLPSFLIILVVAMFFTRLMNVGLVQRAFMGIRPAVAALIAFSVYKIAKTSSIKRIWYIIVVAAFALVQFLKFDPILVIVFSGISGIFLGVRRGEEGV